MELHADEPRVVPQLDYLRQLPVGRNAGKTKPCMFQSILVPDVDLVAMAMSLADASAAIDICHPAVGREQCFVSAEPHRSAKIAIRLASLQRISARPFGHQSDHRMLARSEFARAGSAKIREVPCGFDHRHLHSQTDPKIRNAALASKTCSFDHALGAALAKTTGNEDTVNAVELPYGFGLGLEHFRIDPVEIDPDIIGDAAMAHRLG